MSVAGRPGGADSGGLPWSGRDLSPSGFEADDGSPDDGLLAALAARRADPSPDTDQALFAAARSARWIVPVVAAPAEAEADAGGVLGQQHTDMAVVTLTAPDGRRALPVFTSTSALAAWDAAARPVPAPAARVAQAAVAEGCDVLVVDVASETPTELRPSMLWAFAQGATWLPAARDPFVERAVAAAVADEGAVVATRLEDGTPPGEGVLRIVLALRPGLDAPAVEALATRVGERLATDGELRARVDGLAFALEPAP
ncbi:MAG: SseB family protein [Actinomycetota bacterium]|nr:SseB family protein [Actinomycetota bacterium]